MASLIFSADMLTFLSPSILASELNDFTTDLLGYRAKFEAIYYKPDRSLFGSPSLVCARCSLARSLLLSIISGAPIKSVEELIVS